MIYAMHLGSGDVIEGYLWGDSSGENTRWFDGPLNQPTRNAIATIISISGYSPGYTKLVITTAEFGRARVRSTEMFQIVAKDSRSHSQPDREISSRD